METQRRLLVVLLAKASMELAHSLVVLELLVLPEDCQTVAQHRHQSTLHNG